MRRLLVIVAALLTLTGVSIVTATAGAASVCQSNGNGCTKAGTYTGPNALINSNYGGFRLVWTKSVVQPYSSGVPLYWTAWVTYTNVDSSTLTLSCPADVTDLSADQEHMSGGSGDDGTVGAYSTTCTDNPDWSADVPPGGTAQVYTTFHNVPWPGSAVAITWYTAGTTDYVYPFGSTSSPPPGASCQSWYVLGLHGINEGYQSEKHQTRSPELADFAKDLKKDGPIYGPAVEVDVPYPTVFANWRDAAGVFNQGPLWANVKQGVADLQTMVHHYTSTCPGSRISLFGYSEGAWIVNVWELKHPAEAGHIYSAALIGDPCYVDAAGNKGLARIFTADCGPADDYIVGQTNIQPTNSDCLLLDPVCGAGYLGTPVAQLGGAYACDKLGKYCPHEQYAGVIANLASWMLTDTT
jgi:hypothetical protein